MLEVIIRKAEEIFAEAVFTVHLDHGDEATCYDCIESGFYSSVMIDASHEPFEENAVLHTAFGNVASLTGSPNRS
jgi:fructose-bisphosphate aldolase class II